MKDQYTVKKCGGNLGHKFFQQHHYLRGAFLRYWYYSEYIFYGLFKEDELIGVVQFVRQTLGSLQKIFVIILDSMKRVEGFGT